MKRLCVLVLLPLAPLASAQTWQSLGLEGEEIYSMIVDSSNPNIAFVGSFGDFSLGTVGGIFRTTNAGASWDTVFRGGIVYDLAMDPIDHKTVYAAIGKSGLTSFSGILKSTDSGMSWVESDSGISRSPG